MSKKNNKKNNPDGILEWIVDFFVSPVRNAIAGLLTDATKIIQTKPADQIVTEVRAPFDKVLESLKDLVKPKSTRTPEEAAAEHWKLAKDIDANHDLIVVAGAAVEIASLGQVDAYLGPLLNSPLIRAIDDVAYQIGISEWQAGFIAPLMRFWNKKHLPLVPEPYRLSLAASKGVIPINIYDNAMAENGFSKEWADMWRNESYQYPTLETAMALLRRGEITGNDFNFWMGRQQLPLDVVEKVQKLKDVIPPLSDLIRFAVREAYGKHAADEQYPTYESWAQKMGLSKEAAQWYWYAHWDRIDVGRMYDNYHRGYWSKEKLSDYLRIIDIHPDDRDAIIDVAYQPPSIRELGYGYDVGAYTPEDIIKYRRWGGLSPDDAKKATGALIDYRLEAEREALRREYMQLYARGKLTEDELETKIASVFTFDDRTELWVERAKLYRERLYKEPSMTEPRGIPRSTAQFLFEQGLRNEAWLIGTLADLNTAPDAIQAYVDQSKYRIAERSKPAPPPEPRQLTIAQLRGLYYSGKIDVGVLKQSLRSLGFSADNADLLTQLADIEKPKPPEAKILSIAEIEQLYNWWWLDDKQLLTEYANRGYSIPQSNELLFLTKMEKFFPVMRTLYRNGWINSAAIYDWLVEIGLPKDRADILMRETVKAESGARTIAEKDLTKAEIIKGVKNDVFTPQQGAGFLMDIGYDEQEAWYLLYINAVVARGDPQGYWEMRKVTEQYKKSQGQPYKDIPDELLILETEQRELKDEVERLKREGAGDVAIGEVVVKLANVEARMRTVMAKLKLG